MMMMINIRALSEFELTVSAFKRSRLTYQTAQTLGPALKFEATSIRRYETWSDLYYTCDPRRKGD